mmetsp:Transcript_151346/g.263824  ORF Transcript_151346/g.263824 Transcript_151346/m.263824 type:complete len:419 (+) Transcript_151346:73-1329(+)
MNKSALFLACLAFVGHARRVQPSIQLSQSSLSAESHKPMKMNETSTIPQSLVQVAASAGDNLWQNKDVQRVLMLLCMIAIGKVLQARFPDAEAGAIQKMLLQFLVPATLFKGLSKEKIEVSHLAYIAGGVALVLARIAAATMASYSALGKSSQKERAKMRRTAIFEISTMASALSVLPFLGEFVGPEYVGLGGMVDLPMKLYMLIFMPVLLKQFGESSGTAGAEESKGKAMAILKQLVKDPITMSLVLGIVVAMVTSGGGTAVFGFAGKALDALAGAQTPVLFLLIGLKLKLQSSTPLFCVVLLLATQGFLLLIVWVALLIFSPSDTIAKFIILFSQGAPSVVGMGVIASAAGSGVQGYSKDFAFDIVGLAFPISSFIQCFAGIMGQTYQSVLPLVGIVLLAVAAGLRVIFNGRFQEA